MKTTPIPTVPAQSAASDRVLGGSVAGTSKTRLAPLRGKERLFLEKNVFFRFQFRFSRRLGGSKLGCVVSL